MATAVDTLAAGAVEQRLGDLLERCFDLALRTDVVAAGSGVVGYFPVYFPEEIVHAAGLRPQPIYGGGTTVEVRQADALLGSFVCSICRSTTELGLDGSLAGLRAFFVPTICDPAKHLVNLWSHNFADVPARLFHVPQNVSSPAAAEFLAGEYRGIAGVLAEVTGRPVGEDALRRSIEVYNVRRRLVGQLYELRRDHPHRLSAAECYLLLRAGAQLRCEDHNAVLAEALALLPARPAQPQDKPRVVFFGGFCEQPPLGMLEGIEDACYIVDDDLLAGMRKVRGPVPVDSDPFLALGAAYVSEPGASPIQHDPRRPVEEVVVDMVRRAGADAAVLAAAKFCEPGMDDQMALARHLDREDIQYLVLDFEERMTSYEQMSMQVETFAESLLFREPAATPPTGNRSPPGHGREGAP